MVWKEIYTGGASRAASRQSGSPLRSDAEKSHRTVAGQGMGVGGEWMGSWGATRRDEGECLGACLGQGGERSLAILGGVSAPAGSGVRGLAGSGSEQPSAPSSWLTGRVSAESGSRQAGRAGFGESWPAATAQATGGRRGFERGRSRLTLV